MSYWRRIETAPKDGTPIILANFGAQCLLTGAPHVWTARWVTHTENIKGNAHEQEDPHFSECSYAATNENGRPTHWTPLPDGYFVISERIDEDGVSSGGCAGFLTLEEAQDHADSNRNNGYTVRINDLISGHLTNNPEDGK